VTVATQARLEPPAVGPVPGKLEAGGGVRRFDRSHARRVGRIWQVGLTGSPTQIGAAHSELLRGEMIATESAVWSLFSRFVPSRVARTLLLDVAQWQYRDVADEFAPARLDEIAAQARAFTPDPFAVHFPTFQRLVYLNALYDISLGFEHSPLIGCTSFVLNEGGHHLLARAFDFEVHDVFDEQKAVFIVREDGKIPFASVAWPGLTGVLSGMNAEGLAVVVHGARAGPTRAAGEPVVHALRRALSVASTSGQAVEALQKRPAMVSHLVIVLDARGDGRVIERIPGRPPFVRRLDAMDAVTNHLEGPGAQDPKNLRVRAETSTLARLARAKELVGGARTASAEAAVNLLRDRAGVKGASLPLGDRRAIDALIATHGVVLDTERRVLWVSEAPHLLGRFVAFDLHRLADAAYDPAADVEHATIPASELLTSGRYEAWRAEHPHH
jgi:hypothetical protein